MARVGGHVLVDATGIDEYALGLITVQIAADDKVTQLSNDG